MGKDLACSRLPDSQVREIEKARTRKWYEGKLGTLFPDHALRPRPHIFSCLSLTRHPYYLRARNRLEKIRFVNCIRTGCRIQGSYGSWFRNCCFKEVWISGEKSELHFWNFPHIIDSKKVAHIQLDPVTWLRKRTTFSYPSNKCL